MICYSFTFSLPPELLACTSPTNFSAFADWGMAFIASLAACRASLILENAKYEWTKPEIVIDSIIPVLFSLLPFHLVYMCKPIIDTHGNYADG